MRLESLLFIKARYMTYQLKISSINLLESDIQLPDEFFMISSGAIVVILSSPPLDSSMISIGATSSLSPCDRTRIGQFDKVVFVK